MDGSVTPWLEALLQYMRLPLRQVKDELSEQAIGPGEPKKRESSLVAVLFGRSAKSEPIGESRLLLTPSHSPIPP